MLRQIKLEQVSKGHMSYYADRGVTAVERKQLEDVGCVLSDPCHL
jgi:hypothetical protein